MTTVSRRPPPQPMHCLHQCSSAINALPPCLVSSLRFMACAQQPLPSRVDPVDNRARSLTEPHLSHQWIAGVKSDVRGAILGQLQTRHDFRPLYKTDGLMTILLDVQRHQLRCIRQSIQIKVTHQTNRCVVGNHQRKTGTWKRVFMGAQHGQNRPHQSALAGSDRTLQKQWVSCL